MAKSQVSFHPFHHFDGLVQNHSISSALTMEILQYCTKPSICATAQTQSFQMPVNTGPGNGLLPDGTKPWPEPVFYNSTVCVVHVINNYRIIKKYGIFSVQTHKDSVNNVHDDDKMWMDNSATHTKCNSEANSMKDFP